MKQGTQMKIFYMLLLIFISGETIALEVDEYINEGIKLHDKGNYESAIQKYKYALDLDPGNSLALYELTLSYMVSKKNKECIKTAKKGLNNKSKLQKKFMVALGSCYSQLGEIQEAIKSFEDGLKMDPTDSHLHLDIAVTLSNIKKDKKAIFTFKGGNKILQRICVSLLFHS